jgi:hypothetical protein
MARCYQRVLERGVDANLERARSARKMGNRQKRRLERILKHDLERGERLEGLHEPNPEVRTALEGPRRRHKHKHRGKRQGTHAAPPPVPGPAAGQGWALAKNVVAWGRGAVSIE